MPAPPLRTFPLRQPWELDDFSPVASADVTSSFSQVAASGACCRWGEDHRKSPVWIANAAGRVSHPTECEPLCRQESACAFFSHSVSYGVCVLCSGCILSSQGKSARYSSWKRSFRE